MSIVWEEPPESRGGDRRSTKWRTIGDQLREHPKRWAKVQHYDTRPAAASKVTRIQAGQMRGLGDGLWQAKARGSDNDGWDLYLRFMGEGTEDRADEDDERGEDEEGEDFARPATRFSDIS